MSSDINSFGKVAHRLSRNPLGIIALFLVLVYSVAALVTTTSSLDHNSRTLFVYFLIIFPFLVLLTFYLLVTRHHDKLYSPSDFSNETNFMKALELGLSQSRSFTELKNLTTTIQEEIMSQPLYKHTRLPIVGQLLLKRLEVEQKVNTGEFRDTMHDYATDSEMNEIFRILKDEYKWVEITGGPNPSKEMIILSPKGKKEVGTYIELTIPRYVPRKDMGRRYFTRG